MLTYLIRFLKDGSGDNLIEFALVAALAAVTVVGGVEAVGSMASEPYVAASGTVVTANSGG